MTTEEQSQSYQSLFSTCFYSKLTVKFHTSEYCNDSLHHFVFFWPQGTPEFVAVSQCVHYFEWRTYSACKNDKFKPQKEVGAGTSDRCR